MMLIALSCLIFGVGLFGVLARKDTVAILASVEVMLGGPLLLLVGLGASARTGSTASAAALRIEGIALLVIVLVAAEAAVGFALLVAVARRTRTTALDELTEVNG
jgi:NADH:ubiquinone oxidoreductase subunit K